MKQRKKLYVRLALLFAAIFSVGCVFMAACGNKGDEKDTEPVHTHSYSVTESKDATCTEDGYITYTCECGDTYTETVKSSGHTWDKGTVTKEATCTAEGVTTYTCSVCGETKTDAIPMTEHTYVEKDITWDWTWNEDKGYTDVTATAKCSVCQTEATVVGTITSKPADGIYGDYTATAELGGKTYSDAKTAVDQGGSAGSGETHTHTYGAPTWTWDEANYSYATATFTCTDESCPDEDGQKTVEVKAEGSAIQQTDYTAPTCGTTGSCKYKATVTFGGAEYSDTTETITIPATGEHEYSDIDESNITWSWSSDYSSCTATVTVQCKACTATMTYTDDNCTVEEDGSKSQASTCETAGHVVYTATATLGTQTYTTESGEITLPLAAHTLTKVEAAAATCETAGHSEYWVCSVCGKMFSDASGENETDKDQVMTGAATGHEIVGTYADGAWSYTCSNDSAESFADIQSIGGAINSVTLTVTDETTFAAAGAWNESVDVVPVIDVNYGTAITLSGSVYITGCEKAIILNTDVTVGNCALVIETTVTLDLNGHTISKTDENSSSGTVQVGAYSPEAVYGNLTIKDSSVGETGAITGKWYPVTIFGVENSGSKVSVLTVESGNITSTSGVAISSNGLYPALEIYITGGNITNTSDYTAIYLPSGDLYVSGGHIEGATGIEIRGGSITVTGGEIASNYTGDPSYGSGTNGPVTRGYAIAENHPEGTSNYPDMTGITISGGTITGKLIFTEAGTELVTITGGSFSEDPSEYLTEDYSAKYNEGTGCYVVQSFVDDYAIEINYDGKDFITLDTCGCGEAEENFVTWTVSVTCDGTGLTDIELVWTSSDETVATVTDGVITAAGNNGTATITVTYIISGNHAISASHDITVSLGGHDLVATYDTSTSSWVYTCANDTGETPRIIAFSKTDTPVASVELVADNETALQKAAYWNQLSDIVPVVHVKGNYMATTAISFTGCEKLLLLDGDLTIGSGIAMYVWTTVTIDLNGHTISKSSTETSAASTIEVGATSSYYGDLTVRDSSTECVGTICGYYYTITVWGADNAGGNKSVLTVESGTITATNGIAISTNGNYPAAEIVIENGKITAEYPDYNPAIYLPSGTLYVHGGEISGATGIEVRGGKAYITGGSVTSTATTQLTVDESKSDGGVADGYAIALTWNSSYPEDRYVKITGTVVVTGVLWVSEANKEYFVIAGGFYSVDPSGFLGDEYIAVESETMEGYYEITEKPEVTVTGLAVKDADKSITLDVINGEDQREITVYILLSDGTYTTYASGLTWTYEGDAAISIDGVGSSVNITATAVGEGKITVSLDGTGYYIEIAVSVTNSSFATEGVLASISVNFSDSTTYSWIDFTDNKTSTDSTGLLTAHTRNNGNAWASSKDGTAMRTQGATTSDAGYFSVNLSAYAGKYVTVYVDMANTGNNDERSLFLSSIASTTAVGENVYAYAPSVTDAYHTTISHTLYIEESTELYITWSGSIDIYKIEITILTNAELAPTVESVAINDSERSFVYDQTAEEAATSNLSATVTTESGTYTGGYYWSSSDTSVITVRGDGNSATISIVGAGEATITVTLCNAPMKTDSCVITVVQKYTVSITGVPESTLSINLGETGTITLGVEILTSEGTALDATEYDVAVQIDDTNVATFDWVTSTGVITITPVEVGRTYISILVSVNNVALATAICNITVVDPDAEATDITYTMHYTIGSTWFETNSLLPDYETDQVTFKYSDTYTSSGNLKDISVTYTDNEGNEYNYTKGLRLKGFNSRDVIITIPDSAYDVAIKLIIDCNTDDSSGTRVASLTGDSSSNVLGSTSGLSSKGELSVIEVSGLTAGEYHVIADNDLYLMGIFITYTVTVGAWNTEEPGTEIPDDPSWGETPSTEGSVIVVFNPDSDGSTFSHAAEQGFTVSGSSTSVSYTAPDGVTYSKALKMETTTSVKFTTTEVYTITLYLVPKTAGSTIKVKIDGESYTVDSDGYVTTTIAAGEHEISKDTTDTYLCYAVLTPTSA